MKRLLVLLLIALPLHGQTTVNVVLNESGAKYKSARIGVGAYGSNTYNDFTQQNLLQGNNPSFQGVQFRQVEFVNQYAPQVTFTGTTVNGSYGIQSVSSLTGTIQGQGVTGTNIPSATYLTVDSVTAFTANTTSGSSCLTSLSTTSGLVIGQSISGAGIPASALTVANTPVTFTGTLSTSSNIVTGVTGTLPIVGQCITGTGIPLGTVVTALGPLTVTLSNTPTVSGSQSLSGAFTISANATATATGVSLVGNVTMSAAATGSTSGETITGLASFESNELYDGITANYMAGGLFSYTVQCHLTGTTCSGGAQGATGTIASNSPAVPAVYGPVFSFTSPPSAALVVNDFVKIVNTSTVPTNEQVIGWTLNGPGTFSIDTATGDLPAAVYGLPQVSSCTKITNTAGQTASVEMYLDSVSGQLNYAFNGYYTQGMNANLLSGSMTIQMQTVRSGYTALINSSPQSITSGWNNYTAVNSTAATETASTTPGVVAVIYTFSGTGSACILNATLLENAHTNPSPWRDAVIANRQLADIGTMRWNFLQGSGGGYAGCTLQQWLQPDAYRPQCSASQYGTGPYLYSTSQSVGLHEWLQGAAASGATSIEIALPVTWGTTEQQNFIDYMDGSGSTTYGAIRIARGQTTPWNQVFSTIVYDDGNETWNADTPGVYYYPGAGDNYSHYLPLTISLCSTMKAEAGYNTSVEKCAMNVQQAYGATNASVIRAVDTTGIIDLQNSSNYTAVGSTTCTEPLLFQSSTTEAWANLNDSTMLQYKIGSSSVPVATYEANLGSVSGACTTSGITGWPEGEGYGLVDVLTHAYLQKGFPGHFPVYNIWQDYGYSLGYSSSAGSSPATSIALFGIWQGTGGNFNRARPRVYAVGAYNAAAGLGTGYPATPTSPPTFNYSAANNIPAESNVPLIHAFAYCSGNGSACTGSSRSVVIVNADPTNAYYITLSGTNVPTGPVSSVLYSSPNITDTNESTQNVTNVTNSVSSPYLVPAHSMIVLPFSTTTSTGYTIF